MENHTNPTYNKRMHQTTDAKLEPLIPYLKPNTTLLDFGSGFNPNFIASIEETGATYYGYDISPIVNQQFKENKINHLTKEDLEAQNETFDVIYLSSVLHEFFSYLSPKDYRDTMATIVKALKPNGYLIIRDWPIIQNPDTYQKLVAKDENAAKIIDLWLNNTYFKDLDQDVQDVFLGSTYLEEECYIYKYKGKIKKFPKKLKKEIFKTAIKS